MYIKKILSFCLDKLNETKKSFDIEIIIVLALCVIVLTKSNFILYKISKLINKLKIKNTDNILENSQNKSDFSADIKNEINDDFLKGDSENKDSSNNDLSNNSSNTDSSNNDIPINNIRFDNIAVNNKSRSINIDLKENANLSVNENIKLNIKKPKKKEVSRTIFATDPYTNDKGILQEKYIENKEKNEHEFTINVNSTVCSTPIFNLRTYKDLDFHYNFLIHNFNPQKINNLIMCKDIHQWMTTSSLSSDDLSDELAPIYFIKKSNGITDVFEYLKIFINTDKNGIKIAFIQKGVDFLVVKDDIDKLMEKNLIKDLLLDKHYHNYNLSVHDGVSEFLTNFLSLVLISDTFIGDEIKLDIENYYENQKTFEYFFNTVNSDICVFNTTI